MKAIAQRTPRTRRWMSLMGVVLTAAGPLLGPAAGATRLRSQPTTEQPSEIASLAGPAMQARAEDALGQLPMIFERNLGQTDSRVQFVARGGGYSLFLT